MTQEESNVIKTVQALMKSYDPNTVFLLHHLTNHFNLEELQTLYFELNVKYEDLKGDTLTIKALELIGFMDRVHRLDELIAASYITRPIASLRSFFVTIPMEGIWGPDSPMFRAPPPIQIDRDTGAPPIDIDPDTTK
ncbi:MAG: hypothetical protein KC413_25275 [Anaerolineales bacterium]|nr:hypothetical protein [Anaerolineales bacterium]